MRPTPAELAGGSSAHREGEGYRPERAAGVRRSRMCRADELGGVPRPFALGRWARTYRDSRPKQVTDWVARLEKLDQTLAAESGSSLLVQPSWIEKNVLARLLRHKFTGPENIGLPLSDSVPTRGRPRLGWRERSSRG
jgi:hypothetical protein